MIVVAGYLTINPDHRAAADAAIATIVPVTEALEGCVQYRYSEDLTEPNRINISEIWESDAAMDEHMAAPEFAAFMTEIGPCIGGDVSVVRYDVAGSTKLF